MVRFSLSPKPSMGKQDSFDSTSDDDSSSVGEPMDDDSETEEAHPLGFSNHGHSQRIGLIRSYGYGSGGAGSLGRSYPSPIVSPPMQRNSKPLLDDHTPYTQQGTTPQRLDEHSPKVVHYFLQTKTPVLLKHHIQLCLSEQFLKNDIVNVQHRIESLHMNPIPSPPILRSDENQPIHTFLTTRPKDKSSLNYKSPLQAVQDLKRYEREMQMDLARKREQMEETQQRAVQSFKLLLQQDEREAERILEREYQQQKDQEHRFAQEEKEVENRRLVELSKAQERQKLEEEDKIRLENELQLQKQEEERINLEYAQKNEYITRAYSMINVVKNLRQQLENFEKNADRGISKRRLEMKKIARGKLNTLSHDKDKIISVAQDVVRAVQSVMQEDADIRQRLHSMGGLQTGQESLSQLGASYFMDLIASNVIVRIQAEGFNGPRGDGFPLANLLAMVSTQLPGEFISLLQSHIYMVCPTAIPTLPKPLPGSSEVELMESLGMIKDKNGTYESFDRFLGRTEGIISMVGGIMSSLPDNHTLFGGRESVLQWLERFLNVLPEKDNPLPLLTAPVLFSFLTATGHMLANSYRKQFQDQLALITDSILPRLDESTVGQPSATRLKKMLAGGMNGFISELPTGALPDLYNIKIGVSEVALNAQCEDNTQSQRSNLPASNMNMGQSIYDRTGAGFNTINMTTMESSMDTIHQGTQAFAFGGSNQSIMPGRFTTAIPAPTDRQISPFSGGGTSSTNHQHSSFGNGTAQFSSGASPFGVSQSLQVFGSQPSALGSDPQKNSPFSFGSTAPSNISMFGSVNHLQPNVGMFGTVGSSQISSNTSIFGSGSASTSFGNTSFSSSTSTPFGASKNVMNMNSSGNTLGHSTFANPFSQSNTFSQTPFGGGNANSTPSNASGNTNNRPPCKFFQQGKCRNGDYCKFSHSMSQDNTGPFSRASSNQYASPFGAPRR